jgi:hypothetical protein
MRCTHDPEHTSFDELFANYSNDLLQAVQTAIEERLTYDQLFNVSEPKRVLRSFTVKGPPLTVDAYQDAVYYIFRFKASPSTELRRHVGYVKFHKPKRGNRQKPLQDIEVTVDCDCKDFRYRWAWANKQRGSSRVGPSSLNKAINRAPRITNPGSRPGLCKHLLATRHYIYGLLSNFPADKSLDKADKLDKLTKYATRRYINYAADYEKAKALDRKWKDWRIRRQMQGMQPAGGLPPPAEPEPQPQIPNVQQREMPVPLPPEEGIPNPPQRLPPNPAGRQRRVPEPPPPEEGPENEIV